MRKLVVVTTALMGAFFSSTAQADDIISRFTIRDQGQFAVDGSVSGNRSASSSASPYAPGFSAEERNYFGQASFGGNVGLGYGFEFFAGLPYVFRNHTEERYSDGTNHGSQGFDYDKGFGDTTFGLKYRAFKSADGNNEVLIQASILHHSSASGFVDGEVSYLHTFSSDIKGVLSANYTRREGGSNSVGYGANLIWQVMPQIAVVPYISGERVDAGYGAAGVNIISGGLQLRYSPVKGWNITPGLNGSHVGRQGYVGTQNLIGGSLTVQKEF
jgi:hypothetical protein